MPIGLDLGGLALGRPSPNRNAAGLPAANLAAWFEPSLGFTGGGAAEDELVATPNRGKLGGTFGGTTDNPTMVRLANGLLAARFDGSDDEVGSSLAAADWTFLHDGSAWTAYVVVDDTLSQSDSAPYLATCRGSAAGEIGLNLTRVGASGTIQARICNGGGGFELSTSVSNIMTGPSVYAIRHTGTHVSVLRNGAQIIAPTAVAGSPSSSAPDYTLVTMSQPGGSTLHLAGDLGTLAVYTGAHTDAAIQTHTQALLRRWFPWLAIRGLRSAFRGWSNAPASFVDLAGQSISTGTLSNVPAMGADGRWTFDAANTEALETSEALVTEFASTSWTYAVRCAPSGAADGVGATTAGTPRLYLQVDTVAYDGLATANWTGATGWQLLVYRFDGSTLTVYRDGVQVSQAEGITPPVYGAGREWMIGIGGASYLDGDLDAWALWDRALTDEELELVHDPDRGLGVTPNHLTDVLAWYRGDMVSRRPGGDLLAQDLSGNARNILAAAVGASVERKAPGVQPAIRFVSGGGNLQLTGLSLAVTAWSILGLTNVEEVSAWPISAGSGAAGADEEFSLYVPGSGNHDARGDNGGADASWIDAGISLGTFHAWECSWANGAQSIRRNGSDAESVDGTSALAGVTVERWALGARHSGVGTDSAAIAEAVHRSAALTDTDRRIWRNYVRARYFRRVFANLEAAVEAAGGTLFDARRGKFSTLTGTVWAPTVNSMGLPAFDAGVAVTNEGEHLSMTAGQYLDASDLWNIHQDGVEIMLVVRGDLPAASGTKIWLDDSVGNGNNHGLTAYHTAATMIWRVHNGTGTRVVNQALSGFESSWNLVRLGYSERLDLAFGQVVDSVSFPLEETTLGGAPSISDSENPMRLGALSTTGTQGFPGDFAALVVLPDEAIGTKEAADVRRALRVLRDTLAR